ncbi:hypothetical protein BDZ94DRAFT_1166826 [Collybia nuda]|uniref:Berberine/berberine-like domain-containing protein n=1 Tax=Collybia nuda TaxID=64659 RepID=A0A9P5Y628_9AGAR|nr:hypothetical protein BDZ94DRAFT_1166826 [Collybia nuda]
MAYYNGDGPLSDAFDEVLAVPTIPGGDAIKRNINQQALNALVDGAFPGGRRTIFNVLAFKADADFALALNKKSIELFKPFEGKNVTWAVTFQPFGKAITAAIAKKPNFQGIETDADLLIFGIAAYYDDPKLDKALDKWAHDTVNWGAQAAKQKGLFAPWLYLNYALPDQDVYGSFGAANARRLRSIRDKYDPNHVLRKLWPGGFKL